MPSRTRNNFTTSKFFTNPESPSTTAPPFYRTPNSRKDHDTVKDLAPYNPFLYRVGHKLSSSFYFEGQGVVASDHYSESESHHSVSQQRVMTSTIETLLSQAQDIGSVDRGKLSRHIMYEKTEHTNYISASFSLPWALFFAEVNHSIWNEEDVEVFVIDTFAVADRARCAHAEIEGPGPFWKADPRQRKIMNLAFSSQEIIVFGCIPESAIVSRLSWARLRESLPSWYFFESTPLSSQRFIPLPDDRNTRYKSWQPIVNARFIELSNNTHPLHTMEWKRRYQLEALNFVLFLLSDKTDNITEQLSSGDVKAMQKATRAIAIASRSLLNWARQSSLHSYVQESLELEDDYELEKLLQSLFPVKKPDILSSSPQSSSTSSTSFE